MELKFIFGFVICFLRMVDSNPELLSRIRQRRAIVFPTGTVMQFSVGIAIPAEVPNIDIATNMGVLLNVPMPDNATILFPALLQYRPSSSTVASSSSSVAPSNSTVVPSSSSMAPSSSATPSTTVSILANSSGVTTVTTVATPITTVVTPVISTIPPQPTSSRTLTFNTRTSGLNDVDDSIGSRDGMDKNKDKRRQPTGSHNKLELTVDKRPSSIGSQEAFALRSKLLYHDHVYEYLEQSLHRKSVNNVCSIVDICHALSLLHENKFARDLVHVFLKPRYIQDSPRVQKQLSRLTKNTKYLIRKCHKTTNTEALGQKCASILQDLFYQ